VGAPNFAGKMPSCWPWSCGKPEPVSKNQAASQRKMEGVQKEAGAARPGAHDAPDRRLWVWAGRDHDTRAVVAWNHGWVAQMGSVSKWKRRPVVKRIKRAEIAVMAIFACASKPLAVCGARSVIHRLDADGNGELSKEEFKDMWTPEQIDAFIFAFINTDDNISISEEELCYAALWAVCIAFAALWLLWRYCLPGEEEGREEGEEGGAVPMSEVPKKKGDLQKMSLADLKTMCDLHKVVCKPSGNKGVVKVDYVDALYTYANPGARPPATRSGGEGEGNRR
jgi:hypothetical protein